MFYCLDFICCTVPVYKLKDNENVHMFTEWPSNITVALNTVAIYKDNI